MMMTLNTVPLKLTSNYKRASTDLFAVAVHHREYPLLVLHALGHLLQYAVVKVEHLADAEQVGVLAVETVREWRLGFDALC